MKYAKVKVIIEGKKLGDKKLWNQKVEKWVVSFWLWKYLWMF